MDLQRLIGEEGLSGPGRARARGGLLAFDRSAASVGLLAVHTLLVGDALLLGGRGLRRQRIGVEAFPGSPPDYLLAVVLLYDVERSGCLWETKKNEREKGVKIF